MCPIALYRAIIKDIDIKLLIRIERQVFFSRMLRHRDAAHNCLRGRQPLGQRIFQQAGLGIMQSVIKVSRK